MIKPIKKVSVNKRTYLVNDFKSICAIGSDIVIENERVLGANNFTTESILLGNYKPLQLQKICDRTFIYMENKFLYELLPKKMQTFLTPNIDHIHMVEILYQGEKEILYTGNLVGKIIGVKNLNDFPKLDNVCVYKENIYGEKEGSILFFGEFDLENQSASLNVKSTIKLIPDDQEILGMFARDNNLYIVCKCAIFKLPLNKDLTNCEIEKVDIEIDVLAKSLHIGKDFCIFISGNKLCIFDGNIEKHDNLLFNTNDFTIYNHAGVHNKTYYLPIRDNKNANYGYFYDYTTKKQGFIEKLTCVGNDGYMVVNKLAKKIDLKNLSTNTKKFITKDLNFGNYENKILCGVEVEVGADTTLKIEGDYGLKNFDLKMGRNLLKPNLQSKYFRLTFSCTGTFNLSNLKFIYRNKGE